MWARLQSMSKDERRCESGCNLIIDLGEVRIAAAIRHGILVYCFIVCGRYEQYVEDAYVAFLKQKGQAEQVSKITSSLVKCEYNEP